MNVWEYCINTARKLTFINLCDRCAEFFEKALGDNCRLSRMWVIPAVCKACDASASNEGQTNEEN